MHTRGRRSIESGFLATLAWTVLHYTAGSLGLPAVDVVEALGTLFVEGTGATLLGVFLHFCVGAVLFPLAFTVYLRRSRGGSEVHRGALFGLLLALFVLLIGLPLLGAVHPLMRAGALQAPGFFALGLGYLGPVVSAVTHLVYGAVLGALWERSDPSAMPSSTPQ